MTTDDLIQKAKSMVRPRQVGDFSVADVGCALETADGNLYLGVCIDTISGMGFCAEHSAIAAMVTAGEFRINSIVAVCVVDGETYILSPCGRCREFMHQIDKGNLNTDVILDRDKTVKLAELLPYDSWFQKIN